jgi:hypothetical protein
MLVKVCCGNAIYKILTTDDVRQRLMVKILRMTKILANQVCKDIALVWKIF